MLCNTARYNESNTRDKFRNFLSECQDETSSFHQTKELYEKKIIKAQTKMDLAYGKLKNKEKSKKAGLSNNFKEFIKQRDFKRKLINSLLSGSTEAEKKYTLIAFKQKRV